MQGQWKRGRGTHEFPDFGRSVNPISTKGSRLCPHISACPLRFSDLAPSLRCSLISVLFSMAYFQHMYQNANDFTFLSAFCILIFARKRKLVHKMFLTSTCIEAALRYYQCVKILTCIRNKYRISLNKVRGYQNI